jgi:hypothetical protein
VADAPARLSLPVTVGVGQPGEDEDPVALVGGADVGCSQATPLRIEPERGQVAENRSQAPSKETRDVLQHQVAGSKVANASGNLRPQPPRVVLGPAGAGVGDGLAGEPGGHNGNWRDSGIVDLLKVAEVGDGGPPLGEHPGAVGVGLGLPGDPGAVVLKRQVQPADAGAQAPGSAAGEQPGHARPPSASWVGPAAWASAGGRWVSVNRA